MREMVQNELEAIAGAYHGDPFHYLGPHQISDSGSSPEWEVRAFLPQAESVSLVLDPNGSATAVPMSKLHPHGGFAAATAVEPGAYQLRIRRWDGVEEQVDDPYRFPPVLTDFELHLHGEGTHSEVYNMLGAHLSVCLGVRGVRFAVWAPNAETVAVVGDFNEWDSRRHLMRMRDGGVWELFIPGLGVGTNYKYNVRSRLRGYQQQKADPYAFGTEAPPKSASVVTDLGSYAWSDAEWLERRAASNLLKEPMSVYEVHLGSWMRGPQNRFLTYRELAGTLVEYVKRMGYTHVEFLPVMEHPFAGSWGYQVISHFAPTARFGSPQDFMFLVDSLHQAGLGVIVDWVPAHFPKDAHGLAYFDGTALYEHADPRKGEHRDWGTLIFNFGRNEVREFLISSALFWLKVYHIDGLRVDAVASMLYLDYSRQPGEWIPNRYGGNENLEAIDFLRRFNELAHQVPGAVTIAEESTAFPGVSRPVYLNGLGFTMKWNMGWMHDMLGYFSTEPIYRKYRHNDITFSLLYAFTENFVLPISHDEVVYGKGSLLRKMPGDEWQRFANVRAFLAYMYAHPGKKLLFMGAEIGQYDEWNHDTGLGWELLQFDYHRKLQRLVRELNSLYSAEKALFQVDYHHSGFEWIDFRDVEGSIISFIRRAEDPMDYLVFVCNFTPVPRSGYTIGVPEEAFYQEVLNTDAEVFGGANIGNGGLVSSKAVKMHDRPASLSITVPPLAVLAFRPLRSGTARLPEAPREP